MKDNRTNRKRRKMAWRRKWGKISLEISFHWPADLPQPSSPEIKSLPMMHPPHSRKVKLSEMKVTILPTLNIYQWLYDWTAQIHLQENNI